MGTAYKSFSGTSLKLFAAGVIATAFASGAHATTTFNSPLASPGVYFGSGNSNVGYTVETSNGIELGLGVSLRNLSPILPTTTNIYYAPTGFSSGTAAKWNFNFSLNLRADPSNTLTLADVTGLFSILNVANGETATFKPEDLPDNIGYDGSGHHPATGTDWGAQNSENLGFNFLASQNGFDATQNDTYVISFALTNVHTGEALGSVSETINATPLPAALPMFASGLGVFGYFARRKKKKSRAVGALA